MSIKSRKIRAIKPCHARRAATADAKGRRFQFIPFGFIEKAVIPAADDPRPPEFCRKLDAVADDELSRLTQAWESEDAPRSARMADDLETIEAVESSDVEPVKPKHKLAKGAYYVIAAIIGLAEFYALQVAFSSLMLGKIDTLFMALPAGFAIPIAGHIVGSNWRKERAPIVTWALAGGVVVTLAAIAWIRAAYISSMAELSGASGMSPAAASFALFVVNTLLFALCVYLAYEVTPADVDGEKAYVEVETARRRLARDDQARSRRWSMYSAEALGIIARRDQLAREYAQRNNLVRARWTSDRPVWESEQIEIPEVFKELPPVEYTRRASTARARRAIREMPAVSSAVATNRAVSSFSTSPTSRTATSTQAVLHNAQHADHEELSDHAFQY